MTDLELDFFSDPALVADPKGYFDRLRSQCPVMKEAHHGSLMVTGYDEVLEVLTRRDDVFSSVVSTLGPIPPLPFEPEGDDIREQIEAHRDKIPWSAHFVTFDGKMHADRRAFLTRLLTFKRLKENERYFETLADRIIDGFIEDGKCNAAHDYAHATSVYAISDLMGIPEADRAVLVKLLGTTPSQIDGEPTHRVAADPLIFLKEIFDGYIQPRMDQPGSDLISELANSRFKDGSPCDLDELSRLARLLFAAAQDTTSKLIPKC
jgi:cytochrome P450